MKFTADEANDILRDIENVIQSDGGAVDWIYEDIDFYEECQQELKIKSLELMRCSANVTRYNKQYNNRDREVRFIRRSRGAVNDIVYGPMLNNAVKRRRKALLRYENSEKSYTALTAEVKELTVLHHAQLTGLRRFWDHSEYKMENLSAETFYEITTLVGDCVSPVTDDLSA